MNNQADLRPTLSRRGFLKLFAAGGAAAVGAYLSYEYAPWLDYDQQVEQTRRPYGQIAGRSGLMTDRNRLLTDRNRLLTDPIRLMTDLVRQATLAANGHNTQPWKFAIHQNTIQIHPDFTRSLPAVDPQGRELWISMGCALENLLVAAQSAGFAAEVDYPSTHDFIQVRLRSGTAQTSPLFDAIPLRQNTRTVYDGRQIKPGDLDQILALPVEPGVSLHYARNPTDMEIVLEYVQQGNLIQYGDKVFVDELMGWLRFNQKEALASHDGLFSRCSGNPEVPRWLGQLVVAGTQPEQQAEADARKLRTSAGAVVVASEEEDKTAWVRTGQVYERLALMLTSLNIQSAFLNQPVEVAELRSQFQSAIGLGPHLPQLLVRFGYANPMPRSLRRPVEQVIIPFEQEGF